MNAQPGERLHALDAVRALALILGVFFHATMSFLPGFPIWPVVDVERTPIMGGAFFVLHIFRMTMFFFIAGFFARLALQKRGLAGFIKDRLKRIGIPLVAGWPLMIASIVGIAVWAAVRATGKIPPAPQAPDVPGFFPLTHLWFLYVLLWLYALALIVRAAILRMDRSGAFRRLVDRAVNVLAPSYFAPLLLALPFLAALWFAPMWIRWFGIPPADMNLIVNPQALVAFGTAFGFGWLVHRQTDVIRMWERRWPLHLVVAIALTIACLLIAGPVPVLQPAQRDATTLAYAICYATAIWSWTIAVVGAALKFCSGFSAVRRYIADASYWIYLIHLPLVLALQTVVARLEWPWPVKYVGILAIAFPLMLVSYEWLVRYTFVGAILNGRRQTRAARAGGNPSLQES
jgi:glucans biosynthesis protein C